MGSLSRGRVPTPCHLTEDEPDAAVANQLEQPPHQGFGELSPVVLTRVARIVAAVRSEIACFVRCGPASPLVALIDKSVFRMRKGLRDADG